MTPLAGASAFLLAGCLVFAVLAVAQEIRALHRTVAAWVVESREVRIREEHRQARSTRNSDL